MTGTCTFPFFLHGALLVPSCAEFLHISHNSLLFDQSRVALGLLRCAIVISSLWPTSLGCWEWSQLSSSGNIPGGLSGHTLSVLADGTAVLFGGRDGASRNNDAYKLELSGTDAEWTSLNNLGDTPVARNSHTVSVLVDGTLVLFGGMVSSCSVASDTYQLVVTGSTASWSQLSNSGDTPSGRRAHTLTAIASADAVLFGGYDGSTVLNDAYKLEVSGQRPPTAHRDSACWWRCRAVRRLRWLQPFERLVFVGGVWHTSDVDGVVMLGGHPQRQEHFHPHSGC